MRKKKKGEEKGIGKNERNRERKEKIWERTVGKD